MGDRVSAIRFFNQAVQNIGNAPDKALIYQLYSSAVIADGTMAQAIYELANANRDMGMWRAAIAGYRLMLALPFGEDPGDLTPELSAKAYTNMSHAFYVIGEFENGRWAAGEAIDLDEKLPLAWLNISLNEAGLDNPMASLEAARKAHEMEPGNPIIETALAFAYLYMHDFERGLRHFEARFPYRLPHFANFPYPKWNGERDKTLYLVSEQGMGDALSFARFIPSAANSAKHINIIVQKSLARLLSASFQHIRNVSIFAAPQPFLPADCWTTFMSLPTALGLTNDEIMHCPHIDLPQFMVNPTWKSKDAKFHIGVAWSGSPASDINHWRSFPIEMLFELYRVAGVQLYSIQVNDETNQLHSSGAATLIRDLTPFINDAADTLAIMRDLDLIITTESAPGHLASLAGIECWIPYSFNGRDWRASIDGKSPIWSPKHRFFRQGKDAQWRPVFERIVAALAEKVRDHG